MSSSASENPRPSRNPFRRLKARYRALRGSRMQAYEEKFRHSTTRLASPAYRVRMALARGFHRFRGKAGALFSFLSPFLFPALGVGLIVLAVWFATHYTLGLSVVVGDRVIGYVANAAFYRRISDAVETRVKDESLEKTGEELYLVETFPVLHFSVISEDELTAEEDLYRELYTMASDYTSRSYGLFLDGQLVGTSKDAAVLDQVLDAVLEYYAMYGEDDHLEILNHLEIVRGEYPSSYDLGFSRILAQFRRGANFRSYTVGEDDTLEAISTQFDVPVPVIRLINDLSPGEDPLTGQTLRIGTPYFRLAVKNTQQVTETEVIPYETEYIYSDELYEGTRQTLRAGEVGLYEIVSDVVYVDGIPSSETRLSREKLLEPVTRLMVIGTKSIAPSGHFIFPLKTYQFISSPYGWRWLRGVQNFHTGLDIAAVAGTPIYAADGGIAVEVGQDRYLGNYVRIDHGNGIQTIYGHCSAFAETIYPGKPVYQGELIAYVGRTGNATGNHLHFSVYDVAAKTNLDPADYLNIKS